ncbi:MAG: hypothetical protein GY782_11310 [Gammaproteobacteria bacterium]|nr:hypothetical protein [Gammaproteobacteria bacterium]
MRSDTRDVMDGEVGDLREKGAVVPVPSGQEGLGFYSTYFSVPKKDGGSRPILNLRPFNKAVNNREKFKMETLQSIAQTLVQGFWMVSVDLKDAYFHVSIHPAHRHFLRFVWSGVHLQYVTLPFGLSSAPRVFTKTLLPVIMALRALGVKVYAYLDDLLIVGSSVEETRHSLYLTIQYLTRAGFVLNIKKSDLVPTQNLQYLGTCFRTDVGRIFLPEVRCHTLVTAATAAQRVGSYFSARTWQVLLGHMAAAMSTVKNALFHMRPLQWFFNSAMKDHSDEKGHRNMSHMIMSTRAILPTLQWWSNLDNLNQGMPFTTPPPSATVTTDASLEGWGGHVTVEGVSEISMYSDLWSYQESRLHINFLELRAIRLTLELMTTELRNRHVLVECDNTTAVSYVKRQGGTRSWRLYQESLLLHQWAFKHTVQLTAVHRRGINNQLADHLSRHRPDPLEWSLHEGLLRRVFQLWGSPQVDVFASPQNFRLPLWYSTQPHQLSLGTNSLAHSWAGFTVYAFPPTNLIKQTLLKIRNEKVEMAIVIIPFWPGRSWYNLLTPMAIAQPIMFPLRKDLLSQQLPSAGRVFHPRLKTLHLTAWKLTGASGNNEVSRSQSSRPLWLLRETLPARSMTSDGALTGTGAKPEDIIRFHYL